MDTTGWPPFGNAPSATAMMLKAAALALALVHLLTDRLEAEGDLGDQDHIRPASHAGMQGDETGIPPHQFQQHHPVMRFSGGVQLIQRVRRGSNRGIKTEGAFRPADIIIDGLWHAHHRNTPFK